MIPSCVCRSDAERCLNRKVAIELRLLQVPCNTTTVCFQVAGVGADSSLAISDGFEGGSKHARCTHFHMFAIFFFHFYEIRRTVKLEFTYFHRDAELSFSVLYLSRIEYLSRKINLTTVFFARSEHHSLEEDFRGKFYNGSAWWPVEVCQRIKQESAAGYPSTPFMIELTWLRLYTARREASTQRNRTCHCARSLYR